MNTGTVHNLIRESIKVYLGINILDRKDERERIWSLATSLTERQYKTECGTS